MREHRQTEDRRQKNPQPPPRDLLGPCSRCLREGGITIYGKRRQTQQAVLHPLHTINEKPSPEPLCAHHVELVAWERRPGIAKSYPAPRWTKGPTDDQPDVRTILDRLEKSMTGPVRSVAPPTPEETWERKKAIRNVTREPGDESDEPQTPHHGGEA